MNFPSALRALNAQNFRRYYVGQTVSLLGSWMQSVATMWLAYRLTNSPAATGMIGFLALFPFLFMTPIAGALSDRVSRKKLLTIVALVLFVHASALATVTALGLMTIGLLSVFAFVQGCLSAIEVTTRHSFFTQLVSDKADLPNAIALNSININGTRFVGPALGGIVIAWQGEAACFAINAVSFLAVVIQLSRITPRPAAPKASQSFTADLAEGWRIAFTSPIILPLVLIVGAVSFCINPYSVLMPAIAVDTYNRGAEMHGIFVSAVGVGALIGAFLLARRTNVRGLAQWALVTAACASAGALAFGLAALLVSIPLAMLAMALLGFGLMGTSVTANTIIQTVTDDDKRGRIVSVYSTFFAGGAPLGHYCMGWVAQQWGAPRAFLLCGALCAVAAAAFAWNLPKLRRHLHAAYLARGIIPTPVETDITK
ncbi:MAG: MFS transporter [Burkholderiales bacterium]